MHHFPAVTAVGGEKTETRENGMKTEYG